MNLLVWERWSDATCITFLLSSRRQRRARWLWGLLTVLTEMMFTLAGQQDLGSVVYRQNPYLSELLSMLLTLSFARDTRERVILMERHHLTSAKRGSFQVPFMAESLGPYKRATKQKGAGWCWEPVRGLGGAWIVTLDVNLQGSIRAELQTWSAIADRTAVQGVVDEQAFGQVVHGHRPELRHRWELARFKAQYPTFAAIEHLAVGAGYHDLHSCSIEWIGPVKPMVYPMPAGQPLA